MCGIAGHFDLTDERPVQASVIERMTHTLEHRGPDAFGFHRAPGVALGHRRLSIIDLEGSRQPLFNEDGSVAVVFNGEIYNFADVRRELLGLGHTFATEGDTEVLVHAWEQWGPKSVDRLRGMFAYAIFDARHKTLFLARDRLGIKPLYYAVLPSNHLIFGSELKALLEWPGIAREVDNEAVEDYFALGYVPEPKTIFRGISKLPPGHHVTFTRGKSAAQAQPVQYWDVSFRPLEQIPADVEGELIERMREAVRLRMIADVPLGAFLSGGVDSSAVVSAMSSLSDTQVQTCSIGFDDPRFNEAEFARRVAAHCGTDHIERIVDPDDYSLLDRLSELYDEPYADSSAIPTFRVCQLAREHVTVALSGDGGDENIAGYRRYRFHLREERLRRLVPHAVRKPVFGPLGALYPKADWAPRVVRAKTTFQSLARDSVEAYFHGVSIFTGEMRRGLFSGDFRRSLDGYDAVEVFRRHAADAPTSHPLSLIQYLDLKTYLVGDILTKVDRASMGNSLEVRVPLLDHEFVDWMSGLPPELKLRGNEGKYVFKKALEPHLPHEVLYRKKMGFAVPLASWFRGPLRERMREALLGPAIADSGIFDRRYVETLIDQHDSGARDRSAPLWTLLMFESFLRRLT